MSAAHEKEGWRKTTYFGTSSSRTGLYKWISFFIVNLRKHTHVFSLDVECAHVGFHSFSFLLQLPKFVFFCFVRRRRGFIYRTLSKARVATWALASPRLHFALCVRHLPSCGLLPLPRIHPLCPWNRKLQPRTDLEASLKCRGVGLCTACLRQRV